MAITQDIALNEYLTQGDAIRMFEDIRKELDISDGAPPTLLQIIGHAYLKGRKDERNEK